MSRTLTTVLVCCNLLFVPIFASSAKMKSTWKNPSATESSLQFTKVLVLVSIKHELIRKVAEDKVVSVIEEDGRAKAIPSYTILKDTELGDQELAKSKIEGMGFDGAIVMRYAGTEEAKKYEQDDNWEDYNYFWGVYHPAWGAVYNSTTPDDTKILIETMFYSLKEEKLIWAGITETKNPKNPAKVVGEIAEETAKYLQKQGLIAKKK
jgi:hypothetical protein